MHTSITKFCRDRQIAQNTHLCSKNYQWLISKTESIRFLRCRLVVVEGWFAWRNQRWMMRLGYNLCRGWLRLCRWKLLIAGLWIAILFWGNVLWLLTTMIWLSDGLVLLRKLAKLWKLPKLFFRLWALVKLWGWMLTNLQPIMFFLVILQMFSHINWRTINLMSQLRSVLWPTRIHH